MVIGPNTTITRLDLTKTYEEFALEANRMGFIGLSLYKPLGVGMQAATIHKVTAAAMLRKVRDLSRAADGTYKKAGLETQTDSYATQERGEEFPVDDRKKKMYSELMLDSIAQRTIMNDLLIGLESDIATEAFSETVFTSYKTALSKGWNDITSTIITNIDDAKAAVKASCGMKANTMVISDTLWRYVIRHPAIVDQIKYNGNPDDAYRISRAAVAAMFELENILIGDAVTNTADAPNTAAFGDLWDTTKCLICRTSDDPNIEGIDPGVGRTIMWNEEIATLPGSDSDGAAALIMEEYYSDATRGNNYRGRFDRHVKTIAPQCARLLTAAYQ